MIVVGHTKGQKQEINIGHVNNQNFVSIPFQKFLYILKITAWTYKIALIDREESYTSLASLLDFDEIPTYNKNNTEKYVFSGKRVYRGLYKSKDGILINADVNGVGNTIRKEYPDAFKDIDMSYIDFLFLTFSMSDYNHLYIQFLCSPANEVCHLIKEVTKEKVSFS